MSGRKTTRTRKGDTRPSPHPAALPADAQGTTTAFRRTDSPSSPTPSPHTDHRRIDTEDLLAIAAMNPSELAALMEETVRPTRYDIGAAVEGSIARVGRDDLFVDLGGKAEGILDRAEAPDACLGDPIKAFVFSFEEGVVRLSTRLSGAAAAGHLEEARESGVPVDGRVTARNSGGFEVRVGSARAFCPVSRMSRLPEVDLDAYVGQTLQFRVIETGEKVVLDRRVLQEEEIRANADEIWKRIEPGQGFRGTVRSVQPFGVFVDIGGVDGLVPRRELSWTGGDPMRLAVGQGIEVHVMEVNRETRKLTLSAKALDEDPWNLVGDVFVEGGIYEGTVARVEAYGAFVDLSEGLAGLVHVSKLPSGIPKAGDPIRVRVLTVDHERRRLELSPATSDDVADVGGPVKGTVAQVLRNGVVVQMDDGRTGWLPSSEIDLPAGTVLAQRFRVGKAVTARVVEDQGSRVSLSAREGTKEEEVSWRQHAAKQRRAQESFGTLGDLLGQLKLPK